MSSKTTDRLANAAERVAALSDADLTDAKWRLSDAWFLAVKERGDDPVAEAIRAVAEIVEGETTRRYEAAWAARTEAAGGHWAMVDNDVTTAGTFQAVCYPDAAADDFHWEGPVRTTIEEAVVDALAHSPRQTEDELFVGPPLII